MIYLLDLCYIAAGASLVVGLYRLSKKKYLADAVEHLKSIRYVRISFYVILIYFALGFLDQIRIPDAQSGRTVSLVDLAFRFTPQERTYSAPFASRVTAVPVAQPGSDEDKRNIVQGVHILGTDINGYDVLYNLCKGAGTALLLSFGTSLISFPIGILLGVLAGYFGGWIDDLVQWLYTTVASVPWLLFVIAFLMVFGKGLVWICLAIGLTSWVGLARLMRGETMKQKNLDYVTAARASGIPVARILYRHILPNMMHLVLISFTLSASSAILTESVLTFIGIGVEPGTASWGVMLTEAEKELTRSPPIWWVFAGSSFVGILPLVLGLNLFGDALRDALDPRLQGDR